MCAFAVLYEPGLTVWSLQIWRNVESLQKGGELMDLASNLSQLFEDLFKKQVDICASHMGTCELSPCVHTLWKEIKIKGLGYR